MVGPITFFFIVLSGLSLRLTATAILADRRLWLECPRISFWAYGLLELLYALFMVGLGAFVEEFVS